MDAKTERVIDFIKSTGLTQKEVSEKAGIPQSNLSKIQTGKRLAGASVIHKLALHLGANAEWLLSGRGEMFAGNHHIAGNSELDSNKLYLEKLQEISALSKVLVRQAEELQRLKEELAEVRARQRELRGE